MLSKLCKLKKNYFHLWDTASKQINPFEIISIESSCALQCWTSKFVSIPMLFQVHLPHSRKQLKTYTAQCNGVKGFPSRYANGLCSSNNSRQSSCPRKVIKEERGKYSEYHLFKLLRKTKRSLHPPSHFPSPLAVRTSINWELVAKSFYYWL